MGKCPRQHCHGDTYLKFDAGRWYEKCLLCSREFSVHIEGKPDIKTCLRYSEIPCATESPFVVKCKSPRVTTGRKEE